jgi:phosphoribosylamine--glycine ligase
MAEMPHLVMKPAVRVDLTGTRFGDMDFKKKTDITKEAGALIKRHGSVLLEEWVDGESFSVQALTDGKAISLMPPVHAERRALEGSKGRLTGGMGSYSTGRLLPFMKQSDLDQARDSLERFLGILRAKGVDYRGPICGRFMAAKKGSLMLDVYATFGGMETLNNLMLLRTQLVEVLTSIADGSLKPVSFAENATMVKYVVPEGYPDKPKRSRITIDGRVLWNNGAKAYFDSVDVKQKGVFTTKERAVAICAGGDTLVEAEAKAEAAASALSGRVWHRKDIGGRDYVEREVKHVGMLRSGA